MNIKQNFEELKNHQIDIFKQSIAGVVLTAIEFRMLCFLLAEPERIFSRKELTVMIWGEEIAEYSKPTDVHIHRIRVKFDDVDRKGVIQTRRKGYQLSAKFQDKIASGYWDRELVKAKQLNEINQEGKYEIENSRVGNESAGII